MTTQQQPKHKFVTDQQPPPVSYEGEAESMNEYQNIDALEMVERLYQEDPQSEYLDLSGL